MEPVTALPVMVQVIWAVTLGLVVIVIVPLAIYLLRRLLRAARDIEGYTAAMLTAGVGIMNNTAPITALNDTIAVATNMVETAGNINDHSATIAQVLAERAGKESAS
ncbi:MAG: hypothetical protein HOB79_01280 [Rhodospirillaceae bacterium]|jgi:hypothetical protein|nr:hypothetical protein [Rhodospirillaceae bacterium]MBT7769783.1 hypothetical protein [Rhodospirillales bacterium]MBT4699680.1 hypothetical protein [Rhodospirillaceae bacterium]MBT5034435.1 hypothetical protein [Rhodospirillaceae bacterium]MBT6218401.1 hypothetical protein [Rhodospirillaceae bacterium]